MSMEFSARTRTQNIRTLKTTRLDVLVIGGGIVGAGLIRDLALNGGIKAGLIDQADFANGTSSASSQLIHGGFRYLVKGDFNLVKQARREREILRHIAPTLVKPIPLAILRYKGDPYPLTGIHLAARYYNCLSKTAKAERSVVLRNTEKIQTLVGPIATDKLKGCVILWDSTVDDARLTLATLKDAHRHGAVIANYVRFLDFVRQPVKSDPIYSVTVEDTISGQRFPITARKIVSTTGPWTDRIWCKDPSYDGTPRLLTENAKGIHLLLPRCATGNTSVLYGLVTFAQSERLHNRRSRPVFVLPGEHETSIVGTTETTPEGEPEAVRPSAKEVAYLLSETHRIFPGRALHRNDIIATYAGIRPLIAPERHWHGAERSDLASREHRVTESPSGIMYIYGGKLTTHRQMAEETVDYLTESLNLPRHCKTASHPLPHATADEPSDCGALSVEPLCPKTPENPTLTYHRDRLIQRYGNNGYQVIQKFIAQEAALAEPITPLLPFVKAELLYALWGEMAMTLEDLLWRRTRIGWTRGQGLDIAPQIAQFIGERNNWNRDRIAAEVEAYRERIQWLNVNI